jgi:flagellar biosynthesis/type III secretory pathway chaperone
MRQILDELIAVLSAETAELRRLLPLLEDEQAALVRGDAAAVLEMLRTQEPVIRRITGLEAERRAVLLRAAAAAGERADALTLRELMRRVPRPPAGLAALRADLRALLERLLALNARNGFLVERTIGHVQRLLGALVSAAGAATVPTYAATGQAAAPGPLLRLVDRRA